MDQDKKKPTSITEEDINFIEQEFRNSPRPFLLQDLTKKLAYKKCAHQLTQEVKKYDPYCIYETGDSICKDYDERLTVSSKGSEHFKGAVVFKVVNKIQYKNFNCEMLEVDYSGGGIFRKFLDYMKKTKTQVLLPSNLERKAQTPEVMKREEDPRLNVLPLDDKDLRTLERNVQGALSKSAQFFNWNEYWQLTQNLVDIPGEKIKEVEDFLLEKKASVDTTHLVHEFFGLNPDDEVFDIHSMSLNYTLDKKHKKDFIQVAPIGWGKWNLTKILDSLLKDLPISAPQAELPHFEEQEEPEKTEFSTTSLKVYLTWREVLSGGIKTPKALNRELSRCREYTFTDPEQRTFCTVYFFPSHDVFVGLKDFYEQNNVPQGVSLTLERTGVSQFNFWLKKSKKKLSVFKVEYNSQEDKFIDSGEEIFTFSLPNKIIHLEKETFNKLSSLYPQRDNLDLGQLLMLIFKNFGLESDDYSLHYQRAYHLVDVLRHTSMEEVELTLHNIPEFSRSDKEKGMFSLVVMPKVGEEKPAIPSEITEEAVPPGAAQPGVIPEEAVPEVSLEAPPIEEVSYVPKRVIPEKLREELAEKVAKERPPKKERVIAKKKWLSLEGEKIQRVKKGEKRLIEEKIESEEHEQEALSAIKEERKAKEREKTPAEKKKEEMKKPFAPEEPVFRGIFAEKLKSALIKKDKEKKKK